MNAPGQTESTGSLRLFHRLLAWRLRYYSAATLKLLLRRWQLWAFLLFAASPAAMPLAAQVHVIGLPVRRLVEGSDPAYGMGAWLGMSLAATVWVAIQAEALRGGAPWIHLRSLPAVRRLAYPVDFGLLLIADLPLLLPFIAYFLSWPASPSDCALAAALAVQWPIFQQLVLRGSPFALLVLATSLGAVLALTRAQGGLPASLLLLGGPGLCGLLQGRYRGMARGFAEPWRTCLRVREHRSPLGNLVLINLLMLGQWNQLPARLAPLIYAGALVWFGSVWKGLGIREAVAAGLLLAGLLPLLFHAAGLAGSLRVGREAMEPWLASAGIGSRKLLFSDLLVLEAGFALLAAGPVFMLMRCLDNGMALLVLPLGGFGLAMLSLLYTRAGGPRFLPKLAIAVSFLAVGWVIIRFPSL